MMCSTLCRPHASPPSFLGSLAEPSSNTSCTITSMKVLVVSARGWHLGYLGCYGNGWISTPALDRLAAEGIVFDQHLADVPDAATARRTWRDGRHHFPLSGHGTEA